MYKQWQELKDSSCHTKTDKNKILRETEDFIVGSYSDI